MELAAPARTSETTDAGTEVMIQEGTIDGSKPNSAPVRFLIRFSNGNLAEPDPPPVGFFTPGLRGGAAANAVGTACGAAA